MKINLLSEKIIVCGLLSTLFVFPFLINFALISSSDLVHPIIEVNFSLVDIIIVICLLLWIINCFFCKDWCPPIKYPPTSILIFLGIGVLSFVNAFSKLEWLKGLIQLIEYFIIFYILLINHLQTIKLDTIKKTLFISTTIILIISFIQHTLLDGAPYLVRGFFINRNVLGAYLCMVIPLIYIEFISSSKKRNIVWMGILLLITYLVLLSGSAILSILLSLSVISWKYGKKMFIRFFFIVFLLFSMYPILMPVKNVIALKEFASIYEQGSVNENYYRRLAQLNVSKNTLYVKNFGNRLLRVSVDDFMLVKVPEINPGDKYKDFENKRYIKNLYVEMQASLNLISENTLLGVGLGNFQNMIGTFYNEFPKINTAEINQHNGYLIIASTMGILGLSELLWIFFHAWGHAIRRFNSNTNGKFVFLGLSGSILASMIESLFSNLIVAGLLTPLIFIIYLSSKERQTNEVE